MKKRKNINNFSIAHKLPKDSKKQKIWKKQREKRGFDDTELWNLDLTLFQFIIPRLEVFKDITMSFPSYETSESYNEKLTFIINSFKAKYESFESTSINSEDEIQIHQNAKKAAIMLGELWFDLWS